MNSTDYKKLLETIKNEKLREKNISSSGWTTEKLYMNTEDFLKKRPTLFRVLNPHNNGQLFLYSSKGKLVMSAKLLRGKIHGRAKMYDEEGTFIGNTYWYYGNELATTSFHSFEEEEQHLIKRNKQISEKEKDKIYENKGFYQILKFFAVIENITAPKKIHPLHYDNTR